MHTNAYVYGAVPPERLATNDEPVVTVCEMDDPVRTEGVTFTVNDDEPDVLL